MTEADVLGMLSMSTEVIGFPGRECGWLMSSQFDQIQVRESEIKELERLMEVIPCDVKVSKASLLHPHLGHRFLCLRRAA
jgi:antiviral helicase SLH1